MVLKISSRKHDTFGKPREERKDASPPAGDVSRFLRTHDVRFPDDLRTGWAEHVQDEPSYGALNSARGEANVVDESGFMTTSWPRTEDDSDLGVDALLATATDPTIIRGDYPSTWEIAAAWNAHDGGNYERYVRYFRQNRDCGIRTSQDGEIEKALRSP